MKLMIAGSGKMGSDIFYYMMQFKEGIVWLCLNEDEKQIAEANFNKKLSRQLRTGLIDQDMYDLIHKKTTITSNISKASDAELVIEAIWEDAVAKQELFDKLNLILPPFSIITTNTSSIPLTKFNIPDLRKQFFFGMHFFFPIKLHNIVEINAMPENDPKIIDGIKEFLVSIERRSIILPQTEHFLLNRLLLPLQNEAYRILKEGRMTIEEIDAMVKEKLIPAGIFEFFDHVGINIMLESVKNYAENFPSNVDYSDLIACFQLMVDEGKLGVKSGQGFYQYPLVQRQSAVIIDNYPDELICLTDAFFMSIQNAFNKNIVRKEDLEYAINEYLGIDIMTVAKNSGYKL